jgi:DmsE family decaheme c-type cytochrome
MIALLQALLLLMLAGAPQQPAQQSQEAYAGGEACATCHEDLSIGFKKTPHVRLEKSSHGCESCHGPGREHAESADIAKIRSFKSLTPTRTNAACLDCHKNDKTHSNRLFDTHSKKAVSCTSCHSVHNGAARTMLLAKPTNSLCATCHASERAHFDRPFAHKLSAGAMDCANCHAPHGGPSPLKTQMLASRANDASCLDCHGDKRGPFAFEHMPVKTGGCTSCHQPHGSSNPRMLIRSEVRQLCLECHTNTKSTLANTPPAFHDLRSERYRNCTTCHTKIHGSHSNRAFLR